MKKAATLLAIVLATGLAGCAEVATQSSLSPTDLGMTPENSSVAPPLGSMLARAN